jgi:hypothetical protein
MCSSWPACRMLADDDGGGDGAHKSQEGRDKSRIGKGASATLQGCPGALQAT